MKETNLSPKVSIVDPKSKIRNPKSIAVRRKRFMQEYRKLYKETKRFVDEVLRQNSHKGAKDAKKNLDRTTGLTG